MKQSQQCSVCWFSWKRFDPGQIKSTQYSLKGIWTIYTRTRAKETKQHPTHTRTTAVVHDRCLHIQSACVYFSFFFFFYLTEQNFVFVMSFVGASERASEWEGRREVGRERAQHIGRPEITRRMERVDCFLFVPSYSQQCERKFSFFFLFFFFFVF